MEDVDMHEDETVHKSHTVKQTVDKIEDGTPWAEEPRAEGDPQRRVVGWRAGQSMTASDVREIIRTDREARREYKAIKMGAAKRPFAAQTDPLKGMPPAWQAFWSSVPHLDPRNAVKQHQRELEKGQKAEKRDKKKAQEGHRRHKHGHGKEEPLGGSSAFGGSAPASSAPPASDVGDVGVISGAVAADVDRIGADAGEPIAEQDIDEEILKLETEMRKKKELLLQRQAEGRDWERKLVRARTVDRDEDARSKKLTKRVAVASYARGQAQGKLRSSDSYFSVLAEEGDIMHMKTKANMARSCALLHSSMMEIKEEIRSLMHEIKAAASSDGDGDAPSTPRSSKALSLSGRSEDPSARREEAPA